MRIARDCVLLLGLLAVLLLVPKMARAQLLSDYLRDSVHDQNSTELISRETDIQEGTDPEGNVIYNITVPKLDIDFREAPGSQPSDRFHLDQYVVQVRSDDETPLARRETATLIPSSALETFLPISIFANSDGNPTNPGGASDTLTAYAGFYTGGPLVVVFGPATLVEPGGEGGAEFLAFTIPAQSFDVEEQTGGLLISDYVDVPQITGFFLSSDNPADYNGFPAPDAFLVENAVNGGQAQYTLGFVSDIPEPASWILMALGAVGLLAVRKVKRTRT